MATDAELLHAWREGDREAGNQLFQGHFEAIRRFFVNKADRDVEDLVQRTFIGCVEGSDRFEGRASFRTYLFAIANNVLREFYRRKRRDERVDFGSCSVVDLGAGPSSVVAEQREQRALLEALRCVPLEFQVALELYYWEKLTGVELGEALGVPENTARSRLRRGKELLAKALARLEQSHQVLESTDADLEGWAAGIRAGLDG